MDYNGAVTSRLLSTVFVELYDDRPLTVSNFLRYVVGGDFNFNGVVDASDYVAWRKGFGTSFVPYDYTTWRARFGQSPSGLYTNTVMHRLALDGSNNPFVLQGGGYYYQTIPEPAPLNSSLDPNATVDLDGNYTTANPKVPNEYDNSPLRPNKLGTIAMARLSDPDSATSQFYFNLEDNSSTLAGYTVFGHVVGDGMNVIGAYGSQLPFQDLNPDTNHNHVRDDGGPFSTVPYLSSGSNYVPLILRKAKVVDFFGNIGGGVVVSTNVPASGLAFTDRDAFIDTGAIFTGTGGIAIGVGHTLGIREGYVLNRSLTNHGTLAPGLELGSITVQSNYFQYNDGTLAVQLAGTTADSQYDRLVVSSGSAFLGGKLSVSLIPGFVPKANNSFAVVTASAITGTFDSVDLPQLAPGLVWSLSQSLTSFSLNVVYADYNHNGVVDAADYVVWRAARGTSVATPFTGADGNGDGLVNELDLAVWRNNMGRTAGGSAGAGTAAGTGAGSFLANGGAPEPSSAYLILLMTLLVAGSQRRRLKPQR